MDKYCIHYDCKICNNRGFLKEGYLCKYENIIEAWKQEFEAKGFGSGDGHLVWDFIKDLERASYRAQPPASEPPKEPGYEQPVPSGFEKMDAYSNGEILIVLGVPIEDLDVNENPIHNCDEMGCGSLDHTIAIIPLNEIDWQGPLKEPS